MMNKILPFLEKNVQWFALGLGVLYLGYMVWAYVVQTPVVVTGIASTPLTPGEVDQHILDTLALPLDRAMKDPQVPEMAVPNFIDTFKSNMDFSNFTQYSLTGFFPDSQTLEIQLTPTQKTEFVEDAPIKALPTLPPAALVDYSTGKSNIQPFAPAAAAGAPGGPPAGPPAAPPAGGAAAIPVAGAKDTSWVTASYTIPHDQLAQAFAAANIPGVFEKTSVLQIQLWRVEALPGGKWSDPKLISPLPGESLPPLPENDPLQQPNYLQWAIAHVSDILQPVFYQVNKGDQWHAPGQIIAANLPVALPPLDPTKDYPQNVVSQYPDDQRHAYFVAHAKFQQQNQPGRNGGRPPASTPPPGMPPGLDGRSSAPAGGNGSEIFADNFPPGFNPAGGASPPNGARRSPPGNGPGGPGYDGGAGMPPPGAPPAANPAAAPDLAAQFPIPPGEFDPRSLSTDITGWAHDDTVEPGHTYRYMVTYSIKNPIWKTSAAKNDPKLRDVFSIQSPPGTWGKPINVASTTNFFVFANSRPGAPTARIKVYKWENGIEKSKVFEVAPGDIIGGKDGDTDFNTGWTIVELRFDDPKNPDSMTVIVMDPNGILDRRDYRTDQLKPELKALDQQVSTAAGTDQLAGGR